MKKLTLAALALMPGLLHAQTLVDTGKRSNFRLDHYISLQANELTKQILAVNNTSGSNAVANPFLLNYEIVERRMQLGLRIGAGYAMTKTESSQVYSGTTYTTTTNEDELNLRVGAEKLFKINDRWQCGVGGDFVVSNNKRTVKFEQMNGTYSMDSTSDRKMKGGGPSAMLRFGISKRVLIGTETSFYYLSGKTYVTTKTNGYPYYTDIDLQDKQQDARFYLPVTFYLTVKI